MLRKPHVIVIDKISTQGVPIYIKYIYGYDTRFFGVSNVEFYRENIAMYIAFSMRNQSIHRKCIFVYDNIIIVI